MVLIAAGGVPFGEASLAKTEDGWRQNPHAFIGTNIVILFAYYSVFSSSEERRCTLLVLLIRLGDAVHSLGQGGPWSKSCWGAGSLQIHFMQHEPCPWETPRLIAFSRDTPQTWQVGKAVSKRKTWNLYFFGILYICNPRSCYSLSCDLSSPACPQGFDPWWAKVLQTVVTLNVNTFSLLWIQDLDNLIQDMDSDENKVSKSTVARAKQPSLGLQLAGSSSLSSLSSSCK